MYRVSAFAPALLAPALPALILYAPALPAPAILVSGNTSPEEGKFHLTNFP